MAATRPAEALTERRRWLAGVETRTLTVAGEGPPVLLLHGYADSADTWRAILSRFAAAGRAATALDLRGFGTAEPLHPSRPLLPQWDEMVEAAVEELAEEHDEDTYVVGNSLGGALSPARRPAQRRAGRRDRPDRARRPPHGGLVLGDRARVAGPAPAPLAGPGPGPVRQADRRPRLPDARLRRSGRGRSGGRRRLRRPPRRLRTEHGGARHRPPAPARARRSLRARADRLPAAARLGRARPDGLHDRRRAGPADRRLLRYRGHPRLWALPAGRGSRRARRPAARVPRQPRVRARI